MPTACVWFGDELPEGPYEPGWCGHFWYVKAHLSQHYLEHVAPHRKPISVAVPAKWTDSTGAARTGATMFCIDSHPTNDPAGAWTVDVVESSLIIGQKPDITVSPSIHCVGIYHGFLQHGDLTDDLGA